MQHSPAPWQFENYWIGDCNGKTIAYLSDFGNEESRSPEEQEVNARLIGTAPEMVELLRLTQTVLGKLTGPSDELLKAVKLLHRLDLFLSTINADQPKHQIVIQKPLSQKEVEELSDSEGVLTVIVRTPLSELLSPNHAKFINRLSEMVIGTHSLLDVRYKLVGATPEGEALIQVSGKHCFSYKKDSLVKLWWIAESQEELAQWRHQIVALGGAIVSEEMSKAEPNKVNFVFSIDRETALTQLSYSPESLQDATLR